MSAQLKPTRRDLLIVVGRLQDLVGRAMAQLNDRNPNRQEEVTATLNEAHTLAINARRFDPPTMGKSRNGWSAAPPDGARGSGT